MDTGLILGIGKVGEAVKILLNIDQALAETELMEITGLASG